MVTIKPNISKSNACYIRVRERPIASGDFFTLSAATFTDCRPETKQSLQMENTGFCHKTHSDIYCLH